jgi:cation transport regulator ChaB
MRERGLPVSIPEGEPMLEKSLIKAATLNAWDRYFIAALQSCIRAYRGDTTEIIIKTAAEMADEAMAQYMKRANDYTEEEKKDGTG